jgi:phosphoglycolate phosphatase
MDLLIFDLDGTLIDSRLDLAQSVNATREHFGMAPLQNQRVYSYVGHGAPALIRSALGDEGGEEMLRAGLAFFLEHYAAHALDFTALYPGVKESLERLSAAGKRMAVLTNKPTRVSRAIVEGLGAGGYFFRVCGGDSFELKKPNPMGVEALMKESGVDRPGTVMIGDSSVDVQTARNAGIRCCGVTYGFQPESLADPAPDMLADRMEQVADWILNPNGAEK